MTKMIVLVAITALLLPLAACAPDQTSNDIQRDQQNRLLAEGTAQTGMPAIKNFRERKLLKDILELRDQTGLVTYTYTWSEVTGKKQFFCNSVGYGIPYATQYTAPETMQTYNLTPSGGSEHHYGAQRLPQADPNGLFSPASAEGTWIMCKDPNGPETKPVYVEPRVIVSPFKLPLE
ncbi:MAG: hypothetical protein KW788_00035 [Candidatus Doudnabacteria bacterium]|nr:hypothetical protein [Candidatus Doudnabacteria bacterium]